MGRPIWIVVIAAVSATAAGAGRADDAAHPGKTHEFACVAATLGGTAVGIAAGSLLGGGVGTLMFEGLGGELGGKAGQMLKCPPKSQAG
jgi:hypothetical protein